MMGSRLVSRGRVRRKVPVVAAAAGAAAMLVAVGTPAGASMKVTQYLKPPTSIGVTTPLKSKPAPGKTVIAISCELDTCNAFRTEVGQAAAAIGWHEKGLATSGTPSNVLSTMETAISEHPYGIIINGVARSEWATALPQAQAAHVAIVDQMTGDTGHAGTVVANEYGRQQFAKLAKVTGAWVVSDSKGKADALSIGYPTFPISEMISKVTASTITSQCSTCKAQTLLVTAADTGTTLPGLVVSAIQKNPSINYVVMQDAGMDLGVYAALTAAGLQNKVKVLGDDVSPAVIQETLDGKELGWNAFSDNEAAWDGIDALARHSEGMSTNPSQNAPLMFQIYTKANIPATNPNIATEGVLPKNFQAQFKRLWKV